MFVCICNALRDREFTEAANKGATNVKELFSMNGCRPQCGQCVPVAQEFIPCAKMIHNAE